jgi:hypothetical protein
MDSGLLQARNGRRKENVSKILAHHILVAYQANKGSIL